MLRTDLVRLSVILLSAIVPGSISAAQPLFESDETLSLILEVPLKRLLQRAQKKPVVPGLMRYRDIDGREVVLDVEVSTRGKSRLEHCSLPPLSVNLKQQQVTTTIFAGQNKLKLVTQCRGSSFYRRYLTQEYAIYKIYNLLAEYSFRVRLLEITYRDTNGSRNKVQPAFFIESDEAVAGRHDMMTVNTNIVNVSQLDTGQLSIFTLFQYLIGNTDWSVRKGPDTEGCCHNGKVIAPRDSDEGWVVLPYDFDQSGIINTKYSAPSDILPIKSVRQRLYRGFCISNAKLDATIARFNDNRNAIEHIIGTRPDGLSKDKSVLKYVRSFYDIINDPRKRQKKIINACQGMRPNSTMSRNPS